MTQGQRLHIGSRDVGEGCPTFIIAEIGINHNGDPDIAEKLIGVAAAAGCDAVKFQKRSPRICVPRAQWNRIRETPWGMMSYIDYKERMEFDFGTYSTLQEKALSLGLEFFASPWDPPSVDFLEDLGVEVYKIASASLTDLPLLKRVRATGKPVIASTGMSSLTEIDEALKVLDNRNLILLQSTSIYPARSGELNLRAIGSLRERYGVPVGYSGHETGLATSVASVALGAVAVERHITLDRSMWGTDQSASVEPHGLSRLVRDIRAVEEALGDGQKTVLEGEVANRDKLRRSMSQDS